MGRGEFGADMYVDFRVGMAYCSPVYPMGSGQDFEMWYQDWSLQVYKWIRSGMPERQGRHVKINMACYVS
jgi:hypothetical protein